MFGVQTLLSALVLAAIPAPQDATLLFVTTPGCVPCRQFAPLVREIAAMGYSVETVDAAVHPELVRDQLQVRQFPTFLMLSQDRIVDRVVPNAGPVAMKPRILKMFEVSGRKTDVAPVPQNDIPQMITHQPATPASYTAAEPAPPRPLPPVETEATIMPLPTQSQNKTIQGVASSSPWLASSVKLRVDAENTHSWGTGTIIDTRQGEALVLTCGHIFRDSQGKGAVEVHLFGDNSSVCVHGRCLHYDLEIDLALVAISPPCPVRAIPIAPPQYRAVPGKQVLSVGCDGGANPTVRTHEIMSIDRIGTPRENALPFHYIQVSGAPVSGRSGGGLFDAAGYLIGVCNTADPVENDGHFVPPHIIRHVLQQLQLTAVYENPSLVDESQTPQSAPQVVVAEAHAPIASPMTMEGPPSEPLAPLKPLAASRLEPAPMEVQAKTVSRSEIQLATLEEIKRRAQDGDEIIVYIKSRRNPEIPGDVIRLNDDVLPDTFGSVFEERPAGSSVIFSSHAPSDTLGPRPVSFPVQH